MVSTSARLIATGSRVRTTRESKAEVHARATSPMSGLPTALIDSLDPFIRLRSFLYYDASGVDVFSDAAR